jgi:hypothetical protein
MLTLHATAYSIQQPCCMITIRCQYNTSNEHCLVHQFQPPNIEVVEWTLCCDQFQPPVIEVGANTRCRMNIVLLSNLNLHPWNHRMNTVLWSISPSNWSRRMNTVLWLISTSNIELIAWTLCYQSPPKTQKSSNDMLQFVSGEQSFYEQA